jgi:hypothetical protein
VRVVRNSPDSRYTPSGRKRTVLDMCPENYGRRWDASRRGVAPASCAQLLSAPPARLGARIAEGAGSASQERFAGASMSAPSTPVGRIAGIGAPRSAIGGLSA